MREDDALQEARANAAEAIRGYLEVFAKYDLAIPPKSLRLINAPGQY